MGRLIDADALKESVPKTSVDIFENCHNCTTLMDYEVTELIDKQPTVDAEPVVRCWQCVYRRSCMLKHFVKSNAVDGAKIDWSDWYCAYGVRDISKSDERRERE